ncbi:protein of unknown function [Taphrina deformans PYCC 5710]|uniref:Mitotic checkpoint regulator, MAD2B-interacting-domain-containing protein n=1 Tax=Taphrina deformans (strain PYCC 5710 / ATCC 11124 / CBS 356.35 / IMI 108563 / JCM 9778 / NBRC 8474) TaxID=1097556 RepID=R4X6H2_TAPDE|nr:protein of unknown function [Taphrina deformans PYCC 5710]|eukprot:CCG80690.1 protein of unknown function [Taphrina deformans PYCC 5710]
MTLVDYGSDSSEGEEPSRTSPAPAPAPQDIRTTKSLFAALPAPKNRRGERKKILVDVPVVSETATDHKDEKKIAVVDRQGQSGLSALLPAPKSRTTAPVTGSDTATGQGTGNGPSLMSRSDDTVVVTGSNTLFRPKSIVPSTRPKNSATPKVSLFSITPVAMPRRDVQETVSVPYEPFLATESRPRPMTPAKSPAPRSPSEAVPDEEEEAEAEEIKHPSESYRYDPAIDYEALYTAQGTAQTDQAPAGRKRRRGQEAPLVMQEYDAAQQYAQNEAYIASGAGNEAAPVRFVGTGKHQLSSLLSLAHSQKDALEESFASQKRAMREGKNKYGR